MNPLQHTGESGVAAPCPICSSRGGWLIPFLDIDSGGIRYTGKFNYQWRVCRRCSTGYPNASFELKELQAYWNKNRVESVDQEDFETVYQSRLADATYWADTTYQFYASNTGSRVKGAFLDIACGLGATVKKFQDMGWRAEGLDADINTKHSHERLGIPTRIGQFEFANIDHQYDLISIAHAIYFITDPKKFFRAVHGSLLEHGEFCVVISNFTSMLSSSLPSQIHTWYPTAEAIMFAAGLEGMELVNIKKTPGSTFMLFKKSDKIYSSKRSIISAIMLATQRRRHLLVGRYVLRAGQMVKSIIGFIKRRNNPNSV
jgi:SAM-dependent methyltransferase